MSNRMGPNYMSRADRAARRDRVLELHAEGNRLSLIADFVGLTVDHVKQVIHDASVRLPNDQEDKVNPMWGMDEDARRRAIILRAAAGARETLSRPSTDFPHYPQYSQEPEQTGTGQRRVSN